MPCSGSREQCFQDLHLQYLKLPDHSWFSVFHQAGTGQLPGFHSCRLKNAAHGNRRVFSRDLSHMKGCGPEPLSANAGSDGFPSKRLDRSKRPKRRVPKILIASCAPSVAATPALKSRRGGRIAPVRPFSFVRGFHFRAVERPFRLRSRVPHENPKPTETL